MKTKIFMLIMALGLIFSLSCTKYPQTEERLLEDLAILTQYDTKADFNSYKTFSVPNAIVKITDNDTTMITNQTATAVLNQISADMQSRGFVLAIAPQIPDLGIQVIYFQNTYIYTYYYDWWGYYPYYYYYYPYYPVYYSSYTTGMVNIELADLKNADPVNKRMDLRWNAFIRGLLTGDHTTSEITAAVDQAFEQTPQLMTTAK
jgi:hypothetical protein